MGDRPIEVFLFCDLEDNPFARGLSDKLSASGVVSSYGHGLNDRALDLCQSVAVCVGENTRSLSTEVCTAIQTRFASDAFRVIILFLPNADLEDCTWLPTNWIEFESDDDPVALRAFIAIFRPSFQVFLCHSTTDKPAVRELYTSLASDGFRPWLDEEDLVAGQDWELTIRNEVRASQVVIVCLSRAAVTKTGFVQKEIRLALDVADEQPEGSIFLIIARVENCDVPSRLRRWQWVDLWTLEGYQGLLRALNLRAKELKITVACGLTAAEVAHLTTWRPLAQGGAVLIISPNPEFLRSFGRHLKPRGWAVLTAESAHHAIEVVLTSQQRPNVALLDSGSLNLPDAIDLVFKIKLQAQVPTMAIILTSRNVPTPDDEVTFEENDFHFLGKPFLTADLVRVLGRIRRRQVRRHFEDNERHLPF